MISIQPHPSDDAAIVFSLALPLRPSLHTKGSDSWEQLLGQVLNDVVNCEETEIAPFIGRFFQ